MWFRKFFIGLTALALFCATARALDADQARTLLERHYIDPLPASVWTAETLDAVFDALGDPYTSYLDAEAYQQFLRTMQDISLVGVGIEYRTTDEGLYVLRVFTGSSADGALLPEDVITAIDGTPTASLSSEEATVLLTGEAGAEVILHILRGGNTLTVPIVRAPFAVPATTATLLDGHIGYISCETFGPETYGHFSNALKTLDFDADRWLVDLRGNGGGTMQAAADTVGLFTHSTNAFYVRDNSDEIRRYVSAADSFTIDPVILLVDGYTASASELFAATVRDLRAGIVIGTRTYGKGVAQTILDELTEPDYFTDGDALKLTTYRNFSASGSTTDAIGVVPDLLLAPQHAADAALLLCTPGPGSDTEGYLRLHIGGWRWYIDLDTAQSEQSLPAFSALLSALPPGTDLFLSEGRSVWTPITADAVAAQLSAAYTPNLFPDVAASPYADAIHALAAKEMLDGNERGEFMPARALTRAELCALLVKVIRYPLPTSGETGFSDVPPDAWYAPYVAAMAQQGLVQGYDGRFSPNDLVSHEQFMVVLARVMTRLSLDAYLALQHGMPEDIVGLEAYSAWAQELVWLGGGLYHDDAVNINPLAPATREEVAVSLYRALVHMGYLR